MGSRAAVKSVTRNRRLHFHWVQAHKVIEGNKIVDGIAKSGVRLLWNVLPKCKTAKFMCKAVDQKYIIYQLALDRSDSRNMILAQSADLQNGNNRSWRLPEMLKARHQENHRPYLAKSR